VFTGEVPKRSDLRGFSGHYPSRVRDRRDGDARIRCPRGGGRFVLFDTFGLALAGRLRAAQEQYWSAPSR
jgi:hypothetical protein